MNKKSISIAIIVVSSCLFSGIAYLILKEKGNILARACLTGIAGGVGAGMGIFIGNFVKD